MSFHEFSSEAIHRDASIPESKEVGFNSPDKFKSTDYSKPNDAFLKEFEMPTFRLPHEDNPHIKPGNPPGDSYAEVRPESPKGQEAIKRFEELRVEPKLEYRKNKLDMSPVAIETVTVERMSSDRDSTFKQADLQLTDKYNTEKKDGRTDWTASEIRQYRRDSHLTWHENEDMRTCQLVPTEIHDIFPHTGGKARCEAVEKAVGGIR